MSDPVLQVLGRLEEKVDGVKEMLREHMDQDTRRFTDLYAKHEENAASINQAKGAKGAIVWVVGLIAGGASAVATMILKAKGGG